MPKVVVFTDSSLSELRAFRTDARKVAGYQLDLIQNGLEPDDWKSFPRLGKGVRELRIRIGNDNWRVFYAVSFEEAIYVLRCFEKKTERTSDHDFHLTLRRYKALVQGRKT